MKMNYEELLYELVKSDERIIILTAENRAAIRNLPSKLENHFIDVGIAEQTMIGMASGLALRGRLPVVHALSAFLTMRAFEFIRTDVGIANLPVILVGSFAGFLSEANGPTHQAIEDVSLMRGIPNVNVFCPADEEELIQGMKEIIKTQSPYYVRYNSAEPLITHENFKIGKAEVVGDGCDVALLVYGVLFNQALIAVEQLENEGIRTRLINVRTLKPIDEIELLKASDECELIVTLEDHFITGGLFSILSEILIKNQKTANVFPIAFNNKWFKPALFDDALNYEGFTANKIYNKIKQTFNKKNNEKNYAEWNKI